MIVTTPYTYHSQHGPFSIITGGYCVEYDNLLQYAVSLGYRIPSPRIRNIENQIIVKSKHVGIWQKSDIWFYFKTDGDSDYATLNWKNPEQYQLTNNGATFRPLIGWQGDGSAAYMQTTWQPATGPNFTTNDMSVTCGVFDLINEGTGLDGNMFGCQTSTASTRVCLNPSNASTNKIAVPRIVDNDTSVNSFDTEPDKSIGHWKIKRYGTGADRKQLWKNDRLLASGAIAQGSIPAVNFNLLSRNNNGTATAFTARTLEYIFAGSAMDGLEQQSYRIFRYGTY